MLAELKNDLLYLLNILESIEKIHIYSRKVDTAEDFFYANDQLNFNATLNLLANIGENCCKISNELKDKNPDIQWQDIKGFQFILYDPEDDKHVDADVIMCNSISEVL